jgi:hypothetical protein
LPALKTLQLASSEAARLALKAEAGVLLGRPSLNRGCASMDYSLAKELKDAGFQQDGTNCKTYTDINDGALVERIAHPTLRTH